MAEVLREVQCLQFAVTLRWDEIISIRVAHFGHSSRHNSRHQMNSPSSSAGGIPRMIEGFAVEHLPTDPNSALANVGERRRRKRVARPCAHSHADMAISVRYHTYGVIIDLGECLRGVGHDVAWSWGKVRVWARGGRLLYRLWTGLHKRCLRDGRCETSRGKKVKFRVWYKGMSFAGMDRELCGGTLMLMEKVTW